MKNSFGEKLRALRKEKKLTQQKMATLLNMTQGSYGKYENNQTSPNPDTLLKISNILDVSVDCLLNNNLLDSENVEKPIGIKIPVLGSIPAGIPLEAIEEILDYEEIPKEWSSQGEYFGLKVKGNSMEPRICSGDVVIVRKQEDAETGDVCVVMVNGFDATLKQIKKDTGGITLVPFNKSYSPVYYSNKEIQELPVRIVGKVVELRGKF